jgi:hypothetical protein
MHCVQAGDVIWTSNPVQFEISPPKRPQSLKGFRTGLLAVVKLISCYKLRNCHF